MRARSKKIIIVCLVFITIFIVCGILAPFITRFDPYALQDTEKLQQPSISHIFGTDYLGRDLFSRVIYGVRYSLFLGIFVLSIISVISIVIGVLSGFYEGLFAEIILFLTDIFIAIPHIILSIVIVGILGNSLQAIIISLLISWWAKYVRLIHTHTHEIKQQLFIKLLPLNGVKNWHIIIQHIVPDLLPQLITMVTLDISKIILTISSLSFLGIGIQPPTPEWGIMILDSKSYFQIAPWTFIIPSSMLLIVSYTFQICGDNMKKYFQI